MYTNASVFGQIRICPRRLRIGTVLHLVRGRLYVPSAARSEGTVACWPHSAHTLKKALQVSQIIPRAIANCLGCRQQQMCSNHMCTEC